MKWCEQPKRRKWKTEEGFQLYLKVTIDLETFLFEIGGRVKKKVQTKTSTYHQPTRSLCINSLGVEL